MALENKIVLYVNGVRIWPESATVMSAAGGYVRFTVTVPAVKEWTVLPKRSHAALFYSDPITNTWRLMCEGEYVGRSKTKTGEGQRSLSLMFEGLHAAWDRITFTNMSSAVNNGVKSQDRQDPIAQLQLGARANGRLITPPANADTSLLLTDINSLIDRTTGPNTRISGFLPNFIKQAVQQTPVDSYYMASRKWVQKMFALLDEEIGFILDRTRATDFIKNGFNTLGLGPNATLHQIIKAYENMAMYHHVPILNPPIYNTSNDVRDESTGIQIIPELMFLPYLYHTVPPASNVIFADQVSSFNETRNFITEPTRIITQLETTPGLATGIPIYYMVNNNGSENVVRTATNENIAPGLTVSHDMFSREELDMGVISRYVGVGIEKLTPDNEEDAPTLEAYMVNAARHHYEVERKKTIVQNLTCTFLPYVLPGFATLVEDKSGPFFGIVAQVQHTFQSTGTATTSLVITNIRDAFVRQGRNRTPYAPNWLNRKFRAQNVADTYLRLFGGNLRGNHAAMLPASQIVTQEADAPDSDFENFFVLDRANLDELARKVMPIPTYSQDLSQLIDLEDSSIATQIRKTPGNRDRRFLEYQFRAGTSLQQYIDFHELKPERTQEINSSLSTPPKDLAVSLGTSGGHRLYGSPAALSFTGELSDDAQTRAFVTDEFGLYEVPDTVSPKISRERQDAARLIQRSIDRIATED